MFFQCFVRSTRVRNARYRNSLFPKANATKKRTEKMHQNPARIGAKRTITARTSLFVDVVGTDVPTNADRMEREENMFSSNVAKMCRKQSYQYENGSTAILCARLVLTSTKILSNVK